MAKSRTKNVLVIEPRKPATNADTSRLKRTIQGKTRVRRRLAKTSQDINPIKIRGTIGIRGFLKASTNTALSGVGTVVSALYQLIMPKTMPVTIPTLGPSRMPPRITGTCSMVALPHGSGMKPRPGTRPSMMVIAARTPAVTRRGVVSVHGLVVEDSVAVSLTMYSPLVEKRKINTAVAYHILMGSNKRGGRARRKLSPNELPFIPGSSSQHFPA